MPKVAIVVLNWRQPQLTIDTVTSLKKIRHPGFSYHIFLVDNGSQDNSLHIFQQHYQNDSAISIVSTSQNLGYVGGNNFGLNKAITEGYDYYLPINNDVLVDPDFLLQLFLFSQQHPLSILAPKIYFAPGCEYFKNRYRKKEIGKIIWSVGGTVDWNNIYGSNLGIDEVDTGQYDHSLPIPDFLSGCCLFIPKSIVSHLGLFDPRYFLYLEDVEYSQRAKQAGYQLQTVPQSVIWHINSGSSSPNSSLQDYFITRNRLLFGFSYASLRTKLALFRESIRFLFTGSTWRKKAVIDFYFGRFGKGSWL